MMIKESATLRNDYASISNMAKESNEPIYIMITEIDLLTTEYIYEAGFYKAAINQSFFSKP